MGRRILNDALRTIVNAERRGKATANLQPVSNVMAAFLRVMKNRGYIKDFQLFDPHRVGKITVELLGRITDCRAQMHRQDIKAKDIEEYTMRTLPTRQICLACKVAEPQNWIKDIQILRSTFTFAHLDHADDTLIFL